MSLTNWQAAGWLVEHKATPEEIRDLFAVAERDLKDSAVTGISSDTQLGLAYNVALQVSTAALAAAGYRAAREKKHYVTLQCKAPLPWMLLAAVVPLINSPPNVPC